MPLLDDRSHHASRPDAVAPADERLLLAVLVEERRAERLGVARPELEDVPDLDRGLETQPAAAVGAGVALARLAQVGEAPLEVASVLDPAEVPAGPVGARDELALAERLVHDDLAGEADGADRAGIGAEASTDLLLGRGARVRAERGCELGLLQAVVAADQGEDERPVG